MPDSLAEPADREARVDAALADYLQALDRGQAPPRDEFLALHQDVAHELAEVLDDLVRIKAIAARRRDLAETPPVSRHADTATFESSAIAATADRVTLVPDYRLLAELARGGMGVVYRCHDPSLDRDLAVKVLQPQFMSRPEIVRRFLEEARIAGQLQHPGVVPIHAVGRTEDDRPYFTMKLVHGQTLADQLRERTDPTSELPRFLKVFEQIAQTIAFAHSCKVIHRDLKPGNVMVGTFGEVQVMDWGLAKQMRTTSVSSPEDRPANVGEGPEAPAASDLTGAGTIIGTPSYMSPEQARGETDRLDERSDVFGLGAILCEILTGHPPFEGPERMDVLFKAQRGDLVEATVRLTNCGAEEVLCRLAVQCLSPAAADRPQSAEEVANAITTYLTGVQERLQAAELERAAAQARAVAAVRARRLGIALAVTIMGLLTLGVGGWFWIDRERALRAAADAQSLNDRTKRAEDELDRAVQLREEARLAGDDVNKWAEALAAAKRAEGFAAGEDLAPDLRARVAALVAELNAEKRDRELLDRLREARLQSADVTGDKFDNQAAVPAYATAFRTIGVEDSMAPEAIATLLAGRPQSEHFAAALFDWSRLHPDSATRDRLAAAANATDPSPERDALRSALARRDRDYLRRTAAKLNVAGTSPLTIRLLADVLAQPAVAPAKKIGTLAKDGVEDLESAVALLRKAQAQYPQDFWINHQLAYYLLHAQSPQFDDAIRFYTAAVSIYNRSPGAYLNLGFALGRKARYEEAIEAVSEAIRLKPDYAKAYGNLITYLLARNRPADAVEKARTGIAKNPTSATTRLALGRALLANGDAADAVTELLTSTRLDVNNRLAWSQLGQAYNRLGKTDEAIGALRQALKIDPRSVEDQLQLGTLLGKKGEIDEALEILQQAQSARPQDLQIRAALDEVWAKKTKSTDSIPVLRESVARDPNNKEAILKLARMELAAGETRSALTHLGMAQDLDRDNAAIPHEVGLAHIQLGNHEAALNAMLRAEHLKPADLKIRLDLGRAQVLAGQLDDALPNLELVTEKQPDSPFAYYYLSQLHERRGDYAAALRAYEDAYSRRGNAAGFNPRFEDDLARVKRKKALAEKIAAVAAGKEKLPPVEVVPFAKICVGQEKFVTAARYYSVAFTDQPDLLKDRKAGLRPAAAAAALRAGLGQGPEGKTLPEAERTHHRKQALDWMTAELAEVERLFAKVGEREFFDVQALVNTWLADLFGGDVPDLGVFPAAERERWHQLLEKANDLAHRARAGK